ncbi:OsmC family protein [Bifidobacterium actinocoloniiforme DSM 22766]|uniref:OsmC family protein n=1 Tax=Bifidobacterium actinocoloniiforme DSM 22766 TaxID=1437605 RepID=A0A086Z1Q4_9BIFI|nr:OsmC family protein [Bifidobacterium actinocoloniiforme]AKV55570.1 peroxiredoxin [Bifidobacterium actinocoloniiforme DSM 22766]KFI40454.1 OsmC family protein [Bifidobacterium actinocoloniiforme DSM 22766]
MAKRLWVERGADGVWEGHSDDGAMIRFGRGEGLFTPGDLVQLALAGCAGMSSQFAVERALGEGKGAKVVVNARYSDDDDAFLSFDEQVNLDGSDAHLSDEDADKLVERVTRHIDKSCTVKHTYERETPVRMSVNVRR